VLEPQALAAGALAEVLAGRNLNEVLAALWTRHPDLQPRQRGAVQDLSYGALRYLSRLDFLLQALISRPVTHEGVRCLLLASLYQLNYAKTRPYAVVDRAVEAARALDAPWAANFVNGVLRNFLRRKQELLLRADEFEPARYSHPQWWINRVRNEYPKQWLDILSANNSHPPLTLRVNRLRISPEAYLAQLRAAELDAELLERGAIRLVKPVAVDKLPGFHAGLVSVQDAGAQYAADLLDLSPGQRVLDACAAPGGKASHILEIAAVELVALDKDALRLKQIEENFRRLQLKGRVVAGDAATPSGWWDGKPFDRILADVPCSASGVVRRHPDIKWLRRPEDIAQFAAGQRRILAALWHLLAPGGKLLYATCSLFQEENEDIVAAFSATQPNAKRLVLENLDGQLLPDAAHDGFYYALLGKTEASA
jgi:16S rRNA (cytosine967-C5)-methyltransferase